MSEAEVFDAIAGLEDEGKQEDEPTLIRLFGAEETCGGVSLRMR